MSSREQYEAGQQGYDPSQDSVPFIPTHRAGTAVCDCEIGEDHLEIDDFEDERIELRAANEQLSAELERRKVATAGALEVLRELTGAEPFPFGWRADDQVAKAYGLLKRAEQEAS